jgi:hypothetical protein
MTASCQIAPTSTRSRLRQRTAPLPTVGPEIRWRTPDDCSAITAPGLGRVRAVTVLLAACSGGSGNTHADSSTVGATVRPSPRSSSAAPSSGSPLTGSPASGSRSASRTVESASTLPAASSSGAHQAVAASSAASTQATGPVSRAFVATPAGQYAYSVTGTPSAGAVPRAATLSVSPFSDAEQTLTMSSTEATSVTKEGEILSYRRDGVYLAALTIYAKQSPYPVLDEVLKPTNGPCVIDTSRKPSTVTFQLTSSDASATVTFIVISTTTAHAAGTELPALQYSVGSSDFAGKIGPIAFHNGTIAVSASNSPLDCLPYRQESRSSVSVIGQTVSSDTIATPRSTHS